MVWSDVVIPLPLKSRLPLALTSFSFASMLNCCFFPATLLFHLISIIANPLLSNHHLCISHFCIFTIPPRGVYPGLREEEEEKRKGFFLNFFFYKPLFFYVFFFF